MFIGCVKQGMYRGNLSVINWWFALCQAVWWCLWLYVLGFSSEGIRLIVFTDSSSGNVGCFINNSSSYTEWSVVQMQNLITSEVLAGNKFNREQNVGRLHLWWIRWCNIYDSTLIFPWFLVRNCSHFINSKNFNIPLYWYGKCFQWIVWSCTGNASNSKLHVNSEEQCKVSSLRVNWPWVYRSWMSLIIFSCPSVKPIESFCLL